MTDATRDAEMDALVEQLEDAGYIEQFVNADKFLLAIPMWNFGIPYRLKQYLDVILQPGYTFSFSPETGYSGLVTGKPAAPHSVETVWAPKYSDQSSPISP